MILNSSLGVTTVLFRIDFLRWHPVFALITTVALQSLVLPHAVATNLTQNSYLLVASVFGDSVLRFNAQTGQYIDDFVTSRAGGLDEPNGMAIGADGNLYVASYLTNNILRFNGDTGAFMDVFVQNAQGPIGMTFGPGGDLYVASRDALGVLRFDGATGASKGMFATTNAPYSPGSGLTVVWWPWDVSFQPDGNLYMSSFERRLVLQFDGVSGQYKGIFADARSIGSLGRAGGIAFGPDGRLFLAGYFGDVGAFSNTGQFTGVFADVPQNDATDARFGPDGNLYVSLANRGAIMRFNGSTGASMGDFTSGGSWTSSQFLIFTVPEPASGALALIAALGIFARRSRASRR